MNLPFRIQAYVSEHHGSRRIRLQPQAPSADGRWEGRTGGTGWEGQVLSQVTGPDDFPVDFRAAVATAPGVGPA